MGRGEKIYIKLRSSDLAYLFGVSKQTIRKWARQKKLNPYSLTDIIYKYINKHLIDKRMKRSITVDIPPMGDSGGNVNT